MPQVVGIDHIAITVNDLEATCAFYERLFGARAHLERVAEGKVQVRQIALGSGALLSVHQAGNDVALVGRQPTIGAGDICLRWEGSLDNAAELLRRHGIEIIAGPVPRRTADGLPSHSIYFRDLDGNLLELMAADWKHPRRAHRLHLGPPDARLQRAMPSPFGLVGIGEHIGVAVVADTDITERQEGALRLAEKMRYQSGLASLELGISEIAPALGPLAPHAAE